MTPLTELTKELTEFDYIKSILASLQRLEALMQASEAPRELPAPVVTVNPPDLTSIEAAIQGLSVGAWGPTASEIAAAIADVMSPLRQGDSADALREVAEGLRTLDHRMKGFGRQAYGGGTVSLAPNSTIGINGLPPIAVDPHNSTTTPLGAGATFTGVATDISSYQQVNIEIFGRPSAIQGDGTTAKGSFYFEFSPDGTNWDISIPSLVRDPGLVIPIPTINVGKYFRVRYLNDGGAAAISALNLVDTVGTPTAQTVFRLQAQLLTLATKELTRTLDQSISGSDPAQLVRAGIMGKNRFGSYVNVDLSDRNAFQTEDARLEVGTFGELATSSRIEEIAVSWDQDTLATATGVVTSGGATAAITNSQLHLDSGTSGTSTTQVTSRELVRYRPGHEIACMVTAAWPTPSVANAVARIGLFDDNNGFWIGYSGSTFGVCVRRAGVDTFVPRSSWNEDLLSGAVTSNFQRGGTPEAIDLTTVNVWRINFGWLGSAPAAFEVLSPDGHWVVFHRIRQPNSNVDVHILNPNLPIRTEIVKTGASATNVQMRTGSWSGSVRGTGYTSLVLKTNTTTTPLAANATFTGTWENCEHHVSVSCTVAADQNSASNGWQIQFSDDATTVRRTEIHAYTGGGSGRTVVAPATSKFVRIVYTNGGTLQTTFSLQTKLSVTQLQAPQLSLTNSIDDTNQSSLIRGVLAGKAAADGNYYNVPVSQTTGNLKIDIAESSAEVQIRALTVIAVNQAVVAGTAVQVGTTALTNRRTITFKADPANTKVLYLGQNSAVSTGNGYPLAAGDSVDIEVDGTPVFYCISQTAANQVLAWMEVGK